MKSLCCPKCRGKLESIIYQGIEVDRCYECKGIWFDCLEAEQLRELQGSENVDVGSPIAESQSERISKRINCPRCHLKMMQILDLDRHALWYEKCQKCHGIWFDAGEFKKFKQNFQTKTVFDRAKQVFRSKNS